MSGDGYKGDAFEHFNRKISVQHENESIHFIVNGSALAAYLFIIHHWRQCCYAIIFVMKLDRIKVEITKS